MKTKIVIVVITSLIFSFTHAFSQAPVKQWDADFGGSQNEELYSVHQTTDGGYISGGYSESGPGTDYWIVKTDANGVKLWDVRFGGNSVDQLTALQETTDGGFILGGISFSGISGDKTQVSRGENDYWIVKTDVNGIKEWDACFGGNSYDELHSLQQTSDGGYILGGSSMSNINGEQTHQSKGGKDYWIVKTDANGVKQWDARFGGNKFEELYSVRQTTDGGYILGGYSLSGINGNKTQASQGGYDYWVVKTDENGMKQWDVRFGGNGDDWLTQLQPTTDGGYILGGWSWSGMSGDKSQASQGDNDYWIVKTDANGVKQWDADFGGSSNDYMNPVQQTIDGGYILGGYSSSPISGDKTQAGQGGTDYWLVKTDANGVKLWDAGFGGSDFDFLYSLDQSTDGGYILGGSSSSGISGDKTQPSEGISDYWILKTDAGGVATYIPIDLPTVMFELYPNPVSQSAIVSFSLNEASSIVMEITDINGRSLIVIVDEDFSEGNHEVTFSRESLIAGIYFLQVKTNTGVMMRKMIVE